MNDPTPMRCPFCGSVPVVQTIHLGAEVWCTVKRCPVNPRLTIGRRSTLLAVKRWNRALEVHRGK